MEGLILLLALIIVAYILFQIVLWKSRKKWSEKDQKFFMSAWRNILNNSDHRYQLLEADKLFDHMMKKRGFQGSLGDKLKKNGKKFSDLNGLWQAHKLRNRLAHEVNAKISREEVQTALRKFKRAFEDIGLHV